MVKTVDCAHVENVALRGKISEVESGRADGTSLDYILLESEGRCIRAKVEPNGTAMVTLGDWSGGGWRSDSPKTRKVAHLIENIRLVVYEDPRYFDGLVPYFNSKGLIFKELS